MANPQNDVLVTLYQEAIEGSRAYRKSLSFGGWWVPRDESVRVRGLHVMVGEPAPLKGAGNVLPTDDKNSG